MTEHDLNIVRNYYNNMLKINDIRIIGQRCEIERRSHARWAIEQIMERAASELLNCRDYISGNESLSLVEIVSMFIEEMSHCVEVSSRDYTRRIFEIARDEARIFLCDYLERRNK